MGREQLIWPHQLGPSHRSLSSGTSDLCGLAARPGLAAPKASGTAICSLQAVLSPLGCDKTPSSPLAARYITAISQSKGPPQSPHPRPDSCLAVVPHFASTQVGGSLSHSQMTLYHLPGAQGNPGSLQPAPPRPAEWMGPLCTRPATVGALQLRSIYKPEFHLLKLGFDVTLQAVCKGLSVGREAGTLSQGKVAASCISGPTDTQATCPAHCLLPPVCSLGPGSEASARPWTVLAGRFPGHPGG